MRKGGEITGSSIWWAGGGGGGGGGIRHYRL